MTLIASLATNDFLIQVGDTRVVLPQADGSCVVEDDASNKLTWFDGRVVLGYSGIASLDGIRTDKWIASQLSDWMFDSESAPLDHLKIRAEETLDRSLLQRRDKRLAIVAVGWCKGPGPEDEYPAIWELSNFYDSDEVKDTFTLYKHTPHPNERFRLVLTPQQEAPHNIKKQIKRALREGQPREKLLSLLVSFVRNCADETDFIGKNLISVYLPVQAEPTAIHSTAGQSFSGSIITTNSAGEYVSMMLGGALSKAPTFHSWSAGSSTPLEIAPNVATPQAADILSEIVQIMAPLADPQHPLQLSPEEIVDKVKERLRSLGHKEVQPFDKKE